MSTITSRRHPRVIRARELRRRSERDATSLCLVEGIRAVFEAADQEAEFDEILLAPELLRSEIALDLVARLRRQGVSVVEVSAEVFEAISTREGPQGIAAVVRQRWYDLAAANPQAGLCWVALEAVQDPGNLGTIVRTCDGVGAPGLILIGDTADPYDPSAIRASTGAVFSRRLVRASLNAFAEWKVATGARLVGTTDRARQGYRSPVYDLPLVLMMGSEQKGLGEAALSLCDEVVSIPMLGTCDSLNLAVATGVILYEALDQRSSSRATAGDAPGSGASRHGARRAR